MEFARFSFKHPRDSYVTLGRDVHTIELKKLDTQPMDFVPPAFFRLLESSYQFDQSFIAESLFKPEKFNMANIPALRMFLAAAGFIMSSKNEIRFMRHGNFIQSLLKDRIQNLDIENDLGDLASLSFCSSRFTDICSYIESKLTLEYPVRFICLLFFTPSGFAYYCSPKIKWEFNNGGISVSFGVIVSPTEVLQLEPEQSVTVRLGAVSGTGASNDGTYRPRIFCEFVFENGSWQPHLDQFAMAAIASDIKRGIVAPVDGNVLNFKIFAGMAGTTIGLIGKFDDIVRIFGKPMEPWMAMRVNMNPVLFFHGNDKIPGVYFVILYIPGDYVPNHPQYRSVSEWAYTWMRRACTAALLIPNTGPVPSRRRVSNRIEGILRTSGPADVTFHGCRRTQVTTKRTASRGSRLTFEGFDDFLKWRLWLKPAYFLDTSRLSHEFGESGVKFHQDQLNVLISNSKNKGATFQSIFFGQYGNISAEERSRKQISNSTSPTIPSLLDSASMLADRAVAATPQHHCRVCGTLELGLTEEDFQRLRLRTEDRDLCSKCILKKLGQPPSNAGAAESLRKQAAAVDDSRVDFERRMDNFLAHYRPEKRDEHSECVNFMIKWFMEYWAVSCLSWRWNDLRNGNLMKLRLTEKYSLEEISSSGDRLRDFVQHAVGESFAGKDLEYLKKLGTIGYYFAQNMDKETTHEKFWDALLAHNKHWMEHRKPQDANLVLGVKPEIDDNKDGNRETLILKSVEACCDLTVQVECALTDLWRYDFYRTTYAASETFSAAPMQSEVIASLIDQPTGVVVVNAWDVSTGVLVLTTIGDKMRVIFLPNGFCGSNVSGFTYETSIVKAKNSREQAFCYGCYAPLADLMLIAFEAKNEKYLALIRIGLDFLSSTELRRRPLRGLMPITDTNCVLNGFVIDEAATIGILSVSIGEVQELIDFEPTTLSMKAQTHRMPANITEPLWPLHFYTTVNAMDALVACSVEARNKAHKIYVFKPEICQIYNVALTAFHKPISTLIGVAEFSGEPMLLLSSHDQAPTFQVFIEELPKFPALDETFVPNFDFEAIPQFVSECIQRFGLSELERVCFPLKNRYPLELAKFDVLRPHDDVPLHGARFGRLVPVIQEAMANALPFDWSAPVRLHSFPESCSGADFFGDIFFKLFEGSYDSKDKNCLAKETHSMITLLTRLNGIPRVLVKAIPKPVHSLSPYKEQMVSAMAARLKSQFPPLTLLRSTAWQYAVDKIPEGELRKCCVIGMVDIGDADGSRIFSALTGVPFTPSHNGTFRAGVNFVPVFAGQNAFDDKGFAIQATSVKTLRNVIAVTLKADRPNLVHANVLAVFSALMCCDLVVVNSASNMESIAGLFNMLIESTVALNTNYTRRWSGDDGRAANPVRLAIVADLGANPEMKVKEFNELFGEALLKMRIEGESAVRSLFQGETTFVDCRLTSYEIARSIADAHLTELAMAGQHGNGTEYWKGFVRSTLEALVDVHNAAGYFGGLLSYIDYFMETGVINEVPCDDNEEEDVEEGQGGEEEAQGDEEEAEGGEEVAHIWETPQGDEEEGD